MTQHAKAKSHTQHAKAKSHTSLATVAKAARRGAKRVRSLSKRCLAIEGDSRVILPFLPAETIQCTITSPPYGDQKDYGSPREIGSGNADHKGYLEDLRVVFGELYRVTAPGGALWLVVDTLKRDGHSIPLPFQAIGIAQHCKWTFQECVIWDKGKSLPWSHAGHFRGVFEYVLLFTKGAVQRFDMAAVRDADFLSSYWVKYPERFNPLGKAPTDLWHIPIPVQGSWSQNDLRHLCPFPSELVRRMVALTTKEEDLILDPFAGTGIVPAMADAMRRRGIGIELNKRYFEAFIGTGYDRAIREAQIPRSPLKSDHLYESILSLRVLKYPKTLFSQISRADRLGDDVREEIAAVLVNFRNGLSVGAQNGHKPAVQIRILSRQAAAVSRIEKAAAAVIAVPPLSKFGLDVMVEVLPPKTWQTGAFRPARGREQWYQYNAGSFNYHATRLRGDDFIRLLRENAFDKKARVPPIFSKIGVRIRPGIPD